MPPTTTSHWDSAYARRGNAVSWHQSVPTVSLELISSLDLKPADSIIDIGGGTSGLATELVTRGFSDVSVLDLSEEALRQAQEHAQGEIHWICEDLLQWQPPQRYALWHDRALLHFFIDDAERDRYLAVLDEAVGAGGFVVIGAFAPDGPETCSGLPVSRYSVEDLKLVLGPTYALRANRREIHHTPTGKAQPFTWAVFNRTPSV